MGLAYTWIDSSKTGQWKKKGINDEWFLGLWWFDSWYCGGIEAYLKIGYGLVESPISVRDGS